MSDVSPAVRENVIALDEPTPHNIRSLKLLNTSVLPVSYGDSYYKNLTRQPGHCPVSLTTLASLELTRLAYFNDVFVGAITAKREGDGEAKKIYICTLGVLSAYRRRGIASTLLKHIIDTATNDVYVDEVTLHVWETNKEALEFYKHHGFEEGERVEGYYKKIEPATGIVLRKRVPVGSDTENTDSPPKKIKN